MRMIIYNFDTILADGNEPMIIACVYLRRFEVGTITSTIKKNHEEDASAAVRRVNMSCV